jgi:glyoxylate/hydroxypyruvate reductase A
VGILGLGVLGTAAAAALAGLGFPVRGWSASPKTIDGVESFAGRAALPRFLAEVRSLVCLLPLTEDTRGILDAALFAALPEGAGLINVGRGRHLVEADLAAALDSGHLSSAVLDVLAEEPPPPGHRLFRHPKVIATPHVASMTHPATAARQVIAAVRRHREGLPLDNVIDRARGY